MVRHKKSDIQKGKQVLRELRNGSPFNDAGFPDLFQVAKDFVRMNGFSGLKIINYSFPTFLVNEQSESGGVSYNGLILSFFEGNVVLTTTRQSLEESLNGKEQMVFGGPPRWIQETIYLLGGKINDEEVSLRTHYSYVVQGMEEVERENPNTGVKYFEWVLSGKKTREIHRRDNSPLWFLTEGKKD